MDTYFKSQVEKIGLTKPKIKTEDIFTTVSLCPTKFSSFSSVGKENGFLVDIIVLVDDDSMRVVVISMDPEKVTQRSETSTC